MLNTEIASQEHLAYARETHRMALDLWDYIFPPWRWGEWWRQYREVQRRVAVQKTWRWNR